MIRWTYIALFSLSLSLHPSPPFLPSLHHPFSCVTTGLQRCEHKAADVTHYFQQRTCCTENRRERADGQFASPSFFISNHERADGDAEHLWLQRVPPISQASETNVFFFLLWVSFISLLQKDETWFRSLSPIFLVKFMHRGVDRKFEHTERERHLSLKLKAHSWPWKHPSPEQPLNKPHCEIVWIKQLC